MLPIERLRCDWCEFQNPSGALSCQGCGARLDVKNLVSDSGWREAPRLRDMTEIHFATGSSCQIEGEIVPVVEVSLAAGEGVYFEHHVLLWKEERVRLEVLPLQGMFKRLLAGMPLVITTATGPGRAAFSRDATGELLVMLLHRGMRLDVREHAFVLASCNVPYSYVRVKGLRTILFGGQGMFMDQFEVRGSPGLLVLHGYGNVFERRLAPGESVLVEPGAFLYKDASVAMAVESVPLSRSRFGGMWMYLARLTGPGRLGIQSMYRHHHTE
jgi:uncharacterized protein (AIM24 family)